MKKILLVTHVSGFIPQFEMNNVIILQQMGYEIHYASNYNNPQYGNDNERLIGTGIVRHQVDFARSPFQIIQNIRAYRQLCILLKKEEFELLHCHTPVGGAISRIAVRKSKNQKIKVVYTVHGFHFYRRAPLRNWLLFYPVEKKLAEYTDVLITINKDDFDIAKKFKLKKNGVVEKINGVGIDVDKFSDIYSRRHAITRIGTVFLSVGELNSNKNHQLVINAMHRAKRSDFTYIICGEGDEKDKLEELVALYNLEEQVHLLGYQRDLDDIYMNADVFIMPSIREGLSVALQEAMASGLPIIATNIRGNCELVDVYKGGWLVPSNQQELMAEVMKTASDADLYTMGLYNMKKIEKYDRDEVALAMKRIYSKLLKEDLC